MKLRNLGIVAIATIGIVVLAGCGSSSSQSSQASWTQAQEKFLAAVMESNSIPSVAPDTTLQEWRTSIDAGRKGMNQVRLAIDDLKAASPGPGTPQASFIDIAEEWQTTGSKSYNLTEECLDKSSTVKEAQVCVRSEVAPTALRFQQVSRELEAALNSGK